MTGDNIITRTVKREFRTGYNSAFSGSISATITEGSNYISLMVQNKDYQSTILRMTREEFLDFVVDCWPDNVAYQFKDENGSNS